jgi:hypothetical protein
MSDIFDKRRFFDQEAYDQFIARRRAREEKEEAQHQAMLKRERDIRDANDRARWEADMLKQVNDLKADVNALKNALKNARKLP